MPGDRDALPAFDLDKRQQTRADHVANAALPPVAPDGARLLTAVEAAILNIQHNRISAAIAGLRVARDLSRDGVPVAPDGADGVSRIAAERRRQIEVEGWTAEHDADITTDGEWHTSGQLAKAAACYAVGDPAGWPWGAAWWKPGASRIRELEKAGALIAAEIDRLLR